MIRIIFPFYAYVYALFLLYLRQNILECDDLVRRISDLHIVT